MKLILSTKVLKREFAGFEFANCGIAYLCFLEYKLSSLTCNIDSLVFFRVEINQQYNIEFFLI